MALTEATSASAVAALALVAAALLAASGCGGDSEPEATSAEGSSQTAATSSPSASAGGRGEGSAPGSTGAGASGGGGKQGAPVAAPSGAREPGISAEERTRAQVASIALESPALSAAPNGPGQLPTPYTCDGKDSWPALRWQGVPADTAELVLFAIGLEPVEGKLFFNWAVAGIDPGLEGLDAGELPRGAAMGRNGFGQNGYSICPAAGKIETYFFALYALPERLSAQAGFDPAALRAQVQALSRDVGIMAASYARPG